jgi:hypothetical protein
MPYVAMALETTSDIAFIDIRLGLSSLKASP